MHIGNSSNHESAVGLSTPTRAASEALKHKNKPLYSRSPSAASAGYTSTPHMVRTLLECQRAVREIPKIGSILTSLNSAWGLSWL